MSNDMQNVPFGSAPIIGFASALASALSTRAHYLEVGRNYRPSVPEQRQGNSIKSLAAMVSAAGDRDASVRALGLVNVAIHGSESEYRFGARQLAVLDTIGLDEIPPGAEGVLAQLVAAATVDLHNHLTNAAVRAEAERDRAAKAEAAARQFGRSQVASVQTEVAGLKAAVRDLKRENEELRDWLEEFTSGGRVKRAVTALTSAPESVPAHEPPEDVKDGQKVDGETAIYYAVRDGKPVAFGCRFPRAGAPGKTDSKEPFDTIAEAKAYRQAQLAHEPRPAGSAGSMDDLLAGMTR